MRREVVASYVKLAGVLLAGLVVGRFGVPRIEPQTTHYLIIVPKDGEQSCHFAVFDETTVLGRRTGYGEEYNSLNCREDRFFDNTMLGCRCPNPP
jgi:hypothetical protein